MMRLTLVLMLVGCGDDASPTVDFPDFEVIEVDCERNECGLCGPTPKEVCNGADDDCDGTVDEGAVNACGFCGPEPVEVCNGQDDDCDGSVDEGLLNDCGGCGGLPDEVCDGEDNDCDGSTDEGLPTCGDCSANAFEVCDEIDNDCDGSVDEGLRNACGECGGLPDEACDGEDNDCDGQTDEGVLNVCGECGPDPVEVCDGEDNDCDDAVDEGLTNVCGDCGPDPVEACDGRDNDCDGAVDEGLKNACGECGPVPEEVCDGQDNNCNGVVDEGLLNACGGCGALPEEICNERDDDCDGVTDEGLTNACGGCGEPVEICNGQDDDCDGSTDEHVKNACGGCGPLLEVCNGVDDDCDNESDEGVLNSCGACGPDPLEVCDGRDNDCDGESDEALLNACGECGELPIEVCNGRDDDCDEVTDEGVTNVCGVCGPEPRETCNGRDDDCDERVDEAVKNACGECGPVPAEKCDEEDNDCDGDVDEQLPLNRCRLCGPLPPEHCDGEDNDCDGAVDEGVIVGLPDGSPEEACDQLDDDCDGVSDEGLVGLTVAHCLGCNQGCEAQNAVTSCQEGACRIEACEEGFVDLDFDAGNGCEFPIPPVPDIYVQAPEDPDTPPGGAGTQEDPFTTIGLGLDAAQPNAKVFVNAGRYAEDVHLETEGVQLRATARHEAVILGAVTLSGARARILRFRVEAQDERGVTVDCPRACVLEDNQITGAASDSTAAIGIRADGAQDLRIIGNEVREVRGLTSAGGVGRSGIGIDVATSPAVEVSGNTVSGVSGGSSGLEAGSAAGAFGIRIGGSPGARVEVNEVSGLEGGDGLGDNARAGAHARGLQVVDSSDAVLRANLIAELSGGDGSGGGSGGRAGPAWAYDLLSSSRLNVTGNTARELRGGAGGRASNGNGRIGGQAVLMHLGSVTGFVAENNSGASIRGGLGSGLESDGAAYGVVLDNNSREVTVGPTNTLDGTPIHVYDGVDVQLEGVEISGRMTSNLGGVVIRNAVSASLREVSISDWTMAGRPAFPDGAPKTVGLRLENIVDVDIGGLRVTDLVGGFGRGEVYGVYADGIARLSVRDAHFVRLRGGPPTPSQDLMGICRGLYAIRTANVQVERLLADTIEPVVHPAFNPAGDTAAAIRLVEGSENVLLTNLSLRHVHYGVRVVSTADSVEVYDSVFEDLRIGVDGGSAAAPLQLSHSAFDEVSTETTRHVQILDEGSIVREACFSPFEQNLQLAAESACVDGGRPGVQRCAAEPRPEGGECRLDMGHLGGTGEAKFRDE